METAPKFCFKVLKTHHSAIHRQIYDAIEIQASPEDQLLNSKSEWGLNHIPRLITDIPIDDHKPEPDLREPGKKLDLPGHHDKQRRQPEQEAHLDHFQTQFKQRKRKRLDQKRLQSEVPGQPDDPGDPSDHHGIQHEAQEVLHPIQV